MDFSGAEGIVCSLQAAIRNFNPRTISTSVHAALKCLRQLRNAALNLSSSASGVRALMIW